MGRISTNVGLITGFPIAETVEKLVAIQAAPRDLLQTKNKKLENEQVAFTSLTAQLIALQVSVKRLSSVSLYSQRNVSSSNESAISVTKTGEPALGSYQFTPVQLAQRQQFQSSTFASSTASLGGGKLSVRFGGFVDSAASLDLLSSGAGLSRGSIRITDRSGASATIDLSLARTTDDVLAAINASTAIGVRAEVVGDRFRLVDETGASAGNLRVEEVEGGTTAASLGLAGINVAASSATGSDVLELFDELSLSLLNDGHGVRFNDLLADLRVDHQDGTQTTIDFRNPGIKGTQATTTLGGSAGTNGKLTIVADQGGADYVGVSIVVENDNTVTAGKEVVRYDEALKRLTIKIDEGATKASDVISAINKDAAVGALFTAVAATGSSGTGLVTTLDSATTKGPASTAATAGTNGTHAKLRITALTTGAEFDDVDIELVDDASVSAGSETVSYDDSNPADKKLIFRIDAGNTTADHVIAALGRDETVSSLFKAERETGSNGSGLVTTTDGATTAGGAIVEPVAAVEELSLADVLATINAAAPGKLRASIAPDGDRLVLEDLMSGGDTFAVSSINGSHVAEDLGLTTTASGATIAGRRVIAGLQTTLLSRLDGGAGLTGLGQLTLTDRSGASQTVDLTAAETLDDVLAGINGAGLGIEARVNGARNGIVLVDTTGASTSNLIVADADGTQTATRLGLAVDAALTSKSSGSLHRQTVSETTLLDDLGGGQGVARGTVRITDSLGATQTLNVSASIQTVGDLLEAIDSLGLAVDARLNEAGDGILLVDTAGGAGKLAVAEGDGTTAADLRLLGTAIEIDDGGTLRQAIEGSTTFQIELDADDSLTDLAAKINALDGALSAAVLNDGSSVKPYRLTLVSERSGRAGALLIDTSELGFSLTETVRPRDALMYFGAAGSSGGVLTSSSTNSFHEILGGVTLDVKSLADEPVNVQIESSHEDLSDALSALVDSYNRVFDKIKEVTEYDAETEQGAVLQGDATVLQVETDLAQLATGRFSGAGPLGSLAALGVTVNQDGRLSFDAAKFATRIADSPKEVELLLTSKQFGLADRFDRAVERLAGRDNSLLVNRAATLGRRIQTNNDKIDFYNDRLESSRQLLLQQFQASEVAIAKLQTSLSALSAIAWITGGSSSSSSG